MAKLFTILLLMIISCTAITQSAFAKKKHLSDYVGFDDPAVEVRGPAHLFQTPSQNMTCALYREFEAKEDAPRCERMQPAYVGYYLNPTGLPKGIDDPGDVGAPWMTDPTLPYGTWWSNGSVACLSEEKGLTCKNRDGHGFFMSKTRVRAF